MNFARVQYLLGIVTLVGAVSGLGGCSAPASASSTGNEAAGTETVKQVESALGTLTRPICGTTENGGSFTGTLSILQFAEQDGALVAQGTVTGVLTDAAGVLVGQVTAQAVTLPVTKAAEAPDSSTGSVKASALACNILNLNLGPLDLNLLGLKVHLNQVILNITADPSPGNLLGNLLCAVSNLLDLGGIIGIIANLLNQILGILGSI